MVRELEVKYIQGDQFAKHVEVHIMDPRREPIIPCSFNWFSVQLSSFLRLIALHRLATENKWSLRDLPHNTEAIKRECASFVREAAPEVYEWRNKVGAHFAPTDPRDETLATLSQSIYSAIQYQYPYYWTAFATPLVDGVGGKLPRWALTKTFEELGARFWPDLKLSPLPS